MAAVRTVSSYTGNLACESVHTDSKSRLQTAAPKDNEGDGSSFSPTDLVGAALGTCMLTTMGIVARRNGIDLVGTTVETEKQMVADPRRRIGKLICRFTLPSHLTDEQITRLRRVAEVCPVKQSLHDATEVVLSFERES